MHPDKAQKYVVFIVAAVALFALMTLFSDNVGTPDITGLAVVEWKGKAELCKTGYYDTPMTKGYTEILYGSRYPDQCYGNHDKSATQDPTNNGRYLREYTCVDNNVAYDIYDCGKNNCQFGACINNDYTRVSLES